MPRKTTKAVKMARQKANEANMVFCDELEVTQNNIVSQNQRLTRRCSISKKKHSKNTSKTNETSTPALRFPVDDPMEGSSKSFPADPTISTPANSMIPSAGQEVVTLRREITQLRELVSSMQSPSIPEADSVDSDSEMEEEFIETIDIQKQTGSVFGQPKALGFTNQKRSITRRLSFSNKRFTRSKKPRKPSQTSAPTLKLPVEDPTEPENSVVPAGEEAETLHVPPMELSNTNATGQLRTHSETGQLVERTVTQAQETGSVSGNPEEFDSENPEILALKKQVQQLQDKIDRLTELNLKLQDKLLNKNGELTFSEIQGYPNKQYLLRISQQADNSDYLFVRELVFSLWPNGIGTATVSGRKSNNPVGSSKKKIDQGAIEEEQSPGQLCPQKVEYIKERLYERRLLMLDSLGKASKAAGRINRIITRVIANNPDLRKKN